MAVQAVSGVSDANGITPTTGDVQPTDGGKKDYTKMTAQEIIEAEKNGETVPAEILTWAKENPDGKDTYEKANPNGQGAEENDAVAYQASLEEQGMSLKEQCQIFTDLSAQKETRDLQNITQMAPYTQQVPTDDQTGGVDTSEVSKAFEEINKEIMSSFKIFSSNKGFKDSVRFYQALHEGTSNELTDIDDSFESIQDVLYGAIDDAKDSKQYGEETTKLGKELKSHTKWWQFKGSRRKAATKAIEQGEMTVKMSERTDKLAQAIAKDNGVALNNSKENIKVVKDATVEPPEDNGETNPTPTPTSGAGGTGGNNQ